MPVFTQEPALKAGPLQTLTSSIGIRGDPNSAARASAVLILPAGLWSRQQPGPQTASVPGTEGAHACMWLRGGSYKGEQWVPRGLAA